MGDLTIQDLLRLVESGVPDPESKIQQMFTWHFERSMTAVRLVLGASATLVVAVLIALFQGDIESSFWFPTAALAGAVLTASYGVLRYYELRTIHARYVSALGLCRELQALAPFLRRYRQTTRQ